MPYKFLEKVATSDIAIDVWGDTLEQLFIDASSALLKVMIDNPDSIRNIEPKEVMVTNDSLEMLLFDLLQEIIYIKDVFRLLLKIDNVNIFKTDQQFVFKASAWGETINIHRHHMLADVKAVTFHQYSLVKCSQGWKARIVLDI